MSIRSVFSKPHLSISEGFDGTEYTALVSGSTITEGLLTRSTDGSYGLLYANTGERQCRVGGHR